MGTLRRRVVVIGGGVAPRGRVARMRLRDSADLVLTLLTATLALALATAYQLIVRRRSGRRSPAP